jgi:hypothetical protein
MAKVIVIGQKGPAQVITAVAQQIISMTSMNMMNFSAPQGVNFGQGLNLSGLLSFGGASVSAASMASYNPETSANTPSIPTANTSMPGMMANSTTVQMVNTGNTAQPVNLGVASISANGNIQFTNGAVAGIILNNTTTGAVAGTTGALILNTNNGRPTVYSGGWQALAYSSDVPSITALNAAIASINTSISSINSTLAGKATGSYGGTSGTTVASGSVNLTINGTTYNLLHV